MSLKRIISLLKGDFRDEGGASAILIAILLIPLSLGVAGGIDLAHLYMVQSRLQSATNEAALNARSMFARRMEAGDDAPMEMAKTYLESNLNQGFTEHMAMTHNEWTEADGRFCVMSSMDVPTLLFGQAARALAIATDEPEEDDDAHNMVPLTAKACANRQATAFTQSVDIILALDVGRPLNTNLSDGTPYITALRSSLTDFMERARDLNAQFQASGQQLRLGIVPFNNTINIGRLLHAESASYIDATVQAQCNSGSPTYPAGCLWTGMPWPPRQVAAGTGSVTVPAGTDTTRDFWINVPTSLWGSYCETWGPYWLVFNFPAYCNFRPNERLSSPDLTNFVAGSLTPGVAPPSPYHWKGCIESRPTLPMRTLPTSIPDTAWDILDVAPGATHAGATAPAWRPFFSVPSMDINHYGPPGGAHPTTAPWNQIPWRVGGNDTLWTPTDPVATMDGFGPNHGCGIEALDLSNPAATDYDPFIANIDLEGWPLYEIGMYWAMSMLSPQAPFSNSNASEHQKYIIMLVGDALRPVQYWQRTGSGDNYTYYGVESWQRRLGGDNPSYWQHYNRLSLLCQSAKASGITRMAITPRFNPSVYAEAISDTNLQNCLDEPTDQYIIDSTIPLTDVLSEITRRASSVYLM